MRKLPDVIPEDLCDGFGLFTRDEHGNRVPYVPSLAAVKATLIEWVEAKGVALRLAVAGTADATKLAIYQQKYDIAIQALADDRVSLAILTPEAGARGMDAPSLATLIKTIGDQWRAAGLAIDAASTRHKVAIAAIATVDVAQAYNTEAGWPTL